jgi:hypothetical protein
VRSYVIVPDCCKYSVSNELSCDVLTSVSSADTVVIFIPGLVSIHVAYAPPMLRIYGILSLHWIVGNRNTANTGQQEEIAGEK